MTRAALHRSNLNQKGHTTVDGSDDGPVVEEPCPGGRHGRKEEGEQKDAGSKANCESGVATEWTSTEGSKGEKRTHQQSGIHWQTRAVGQKLKVRHVEECTAISSSPTK